MVQRYRCPVCDKSHSEEQPVDGLRMDYAKVVQIVKLLTEGMSARATARFVGCHHDSVADVLCIVGRKCEAFLDKRIVNIAPHSLQLDELWARVGCSQKRATSFDRERGDFYTFLALETRTKLIVSYHTGKRDYENTNEFVEDLADRVVGRVQITCDGWLPYPSTIRNHLLGRLDLTVLQKHYANMELPIEAKRRYSPPEVASITIETHAGMPDIDKVCTSHVERLNLTVRTHNRRFTRLSLAMSRKLRNHCYSVALFVAAYNFTKVHTTLGTTPAVGAKLTDHVWSVEELLAAIEE